MDQHDDRYRETRDIWADYNERQKFEHELLDRKTTWLIATQSILFAAYGVTFRSEGTGGEGLDTFRDVVAASGLAIAVITLVGVVALLISKLLSWQDYKRFFAGSETPNPPRPLDRKALQWGVRSWNTPFALLPDLLLPNVFIVGWLWLLL